MQNKINTSTKILIAILLSLSVLVAKSMFLILFLTILCLILLLTEKSVKEYINLLKNTIFLLLFVFITYIIIFRNILNGTLVIYKLFLISIIFYKLILKNSFEKLNNGLYTLFNKIFNDKIIYNITCFIYFIKFYINYNIKSKYKFSIKHNFLPKIFNVVSKIDKLENSLNLKCYKVKKEQKNVSSEILKYIVIFLFIVVIFKEVIL